MSRVIVGVMGPGENAGAREVETAFTLGKLIAKEGWVLLSGGRDSGVMDAASRGAKSASGLTVGILPSKNSDGMSQAIDLPILTDVGEARNNINVLSSRVVFAYGMEAGTASEVALALKAKRKVVLLEISNEAKAFFEEIGGSNIFHASNPQEAIKMAKKFLRSSSAD